MKQHQKKPRTEQEVPKKIFFSLNEYKLAINNKKIVLLRKIKIVDPKKTTLLIRQHWMMTSKE
jgi:hypothetical protein